MTDDANSPPATDTKPVIVTVYADGPYVVSGPIDIRNGDGATVKLTSKAAFCRCGHSESKPFCDGSHKRVGFTDPGPAVPEAGA